MLLDRLQKMLDSGYTEKEFIQFASNTFKYVFEAVENKKLIIKIKEDAKIEGSKLSTKQYYYYTFMHHIKKILDSGIKFKNLMNPTTDKEQILLSHYLLPILDIINYIHPKAEEYNEFVYNFMFDENKLSNYDKLYIIHNIGDVNKYIEILSVDDVKKYMSDYITCITGDIYYKHKDKIGLFVKFLIDTAEYRKDFQKRGMDQHGNAVKVAMNSAYGVLGLKTFRYSNANLARSITTMGRFTLKSTQYIAEEFLRNRYG
jgi:hypothetical protein